MGEVVAYEPYNPVPGRPKMGPVTTSFGITISPVGTFDDDDEEGGRLSETSGNTSGYNPARTATPLNPGSSLGVCSRPLVTSVLV